MKMLLLFTFLLIPSVALGVDEAAKVMQSNQRGEDGVILRAGEIANTGQHIIIAAGADTVVVLDFPNSTAGSMINLVLKSGTSGSADSIWFYHHNTAGAIIDSTLHLGELGIISTHPYTVAEGDSIHLDINSNTGSIWARIDAIKGGTVNVSP